MTHKAVIASAAKQPLARAVQFSLSLYLAIEIAP
jgi:hypothetical protein